MVKREIKGRYFVAFLLTTSIFVLGIFLGIIMSDYKTSKIYDYERELATTFLIQNVQSELLASDPCKFINTSFLSNELFIVGDRLTSLEKDLGKTNKNVLSLKKYYMVLQLKNYLFLKKVNKDCGEKFILNLFFYSNDPLTCETCVDQGFVLTYLRAKNDRIRTYSFDMDLDMPLIKYLSEYYNVTTLPTVVFNDTVYSSFISKERAEELLKPLR